MSTMGKKHKKHGKIDSDFSESKEDSLQEKPGLKLVLKVGGAPATPEVIASDSFTEEGSNVEKKRHKRKKHQHEKHRHHENKVKQEMEIEEVGEESEEDFEPPPPKCSHLVEEEEGEDQSKVRILRDKKSTEDDKSPLEWCLEYLQKILQRKDTNGFFSFPVTDNIAPGYSSIISHPMDFSTMKAKIENGEYQSVAEYRNDFQLMMNNCMAYNHADTIYHKEAKRLLMVGLKYTSKEKMLQMKRNFTFMSNIAKEELGFDDDSAADSSNSVTDAQPEVRRLPNQKIKKLSFGKFEAIPDNMTPEEILEQAQSAAQDAATTLTLRCPDSKIGFLRRKKDGTTSLNILNPDNDGIVSETERVVDLSSLGGRLTSGTSNLLTVKEDKRNKVTPVNYLNYGVFSSYAPIYDSTSATISKEDSDLLLSTYGDETGVQYAKSIQHFVADSGDYAVSMVDELLNLLTNGDHSKTMEILRLEEEKLKEQQILSANEVETTNVEWRIPVPVGGVSSIDMSFLDNARNVQPCTFDENSDRQRQLERTSDMLLELHQVQLGRLSQSLPDNLSQIKGPSSEEIELGNKVTAELVQLCKQANPADIVGTDALRSAMGITMQSVGDESGSQDVYVINDDNQSLQTLQGATTASTELVQDFNDFFSQGSGCAQDNVLRINVNDVTDEQIGCSESVMIS